MVFQLTNQSIDQSSNKATNQASKAKQKILITAHHLFYTKGIRATGIDLIIAEAKVTKTTFYRHFSSKHILILAYLDYRHQIWLEWFQQGLNAHADAVEGIVATMTEWFTQDYFRGCAFINSLSEIATELPEVKIKVAEHKRDVVTLIAEKLSSQGQGGIIDNQHKAQGIVMAIDGAIIRVHSGEDRQQTTALLGKTVSLLIQG